MAEANCSQEVNATAKADQPKVYTKEEISRTAPNYRGKPENFVRGFKATPKQKKEAKTKATSSKTSLGGKTFEEFEKGLAPTHLNAGPPTPTIEQRSWADKVEQAEGEEDKAFTNNRENLIRSFFYSTKPAYIGQSFDEYETAVQVWAIELSLLLRKATSTCTKDGCQCCIRFKDLVPTSFVTEFEHAIGGLCKDILFKQSHFRALCRRIQEENQQGKTVKYLVNMMLNVKLLAKREVELESQLVPIEEVSQEEVRKEATRPEYQGIDSKTCKHITPEKMWITAYNLAMMKHSFIDECREEGKHKSKLDLKAAWLTTIIDKRTAKNSWYDTHRLDLFRSIGKWITTRLNEVCCRYCQAGMRIRYRHLEESSLVWRAWRLYQLLNILRHLKNESNVWARKNLNTWNEF